MTLGPGSDDEFDPWDLADVRVVLPVGNRLEDWVCESVYWGERPHLDFSIPLRRA